MIADAVRVSATRCSALQGTVPSTSRPPSGATLSQRKSVSLTFKPFDAERLLGAVEKALG